MKTDTVAQKLYLKMLLLKKTLQFHKLKRAKPNWIKIL